MRHINFSLNKLKKNPEVVLLIDASAAHKEPQTETKKSSLETARDAFESVRSIALSIIIFVGGFTVAVAIGQEIFSDYILIDVTEVSKKLADSGISPSTIGAELSERVSSLHAEADSKDILPSIELAYLLQSENKTKALPSLPASSQKLLIDHVRPIPELITSAIDSNIRSAIGYVRHVFGRQDNRLSIALTTTDEQQFEARLRLHRKKDSAVVIISKPTLDQLLAEVTSWLAKQLFPEEYIVTQFSKEAQENELIFTNTKETLQELAKSRGGFNDAFLLTILGDIAFYKESYSEASAIYRSVDSNDPRLRNLVIYRLSQSLVAESKLRDAIVLLSDEIEKYPSDYILLSYLSLIYAQSQLEVELNDISNDCEVSGNCLSIEKLTGLLKDNAIYSAAVSNAMGVFSFQGFDLVGADYFFRMATTSDPQYAAALNNMGVLRLVDDDAGEALLYLQKAFAANENSGVTHLNLGNAFEQVDRIYDATYHFKMAVRLERENLVCHTCWAAALLRDGKIDEAIAAVKSGLKMKPNSASLYLVLALIYSKLGCYSEAVDFYESVIEVNDSRLRRSLVFQEYGSALLKSGENKKAMAAFKVEEKAYRNELTISDRLNKSVAHFYTAQSLSAGDAVTMFKLESDILNLADKQERDEVAEAYRRFAEALLFKGEAGFASKIAKVAVELTPKDWAVHFMLGKIYLGLGKDSLARNEFRLALLLGGENDIELLQSWSSSLKDEKLSSAVRAEFKIHPLACQSGAI